MAITTLQGVADAMPGGRYKHNKGGSSGTGQFYVFWDNSTNSFPAGASTPSSGVTGDVPTNATAGAIPFTNPTGGALTYLAAAHISMAAVGTLMIYDRLWHNSGLSVTSTSLQSVGSVSLPARANGGVGAELWLDNYTTMGSGAPTITAGYTNSGGTGSRTATLFGMQSSSSAGRTFPFAYNAGDIGIQSIQDFTMSATRNSGTHGLVLRKRYATLNYRTPGDKMAFDVFALSMPIIPDDACLEFLSVNNNRLYGDIYLVQG